MMRSIVAIRGEPGLSRTLALAASQAIAVTGVPLFHVAPVPWALPEAADFDGLLIGSANAVRHGGPLLDRLKHIPVFAVGAQTATIAAQAGFTIAHTGQGGLQSVLDDLSCQSKAFLRLAGADRVPLALHSGQMMTEICVYENRALPAPRQLAQQLASGGIVLLHSAAAAVHFANECSRLEVDRAGITLAVLGPRIADHTGEGWAAIHVAERPDDAALLALVRNICQ